MRKLALPPFLAVLLIATYMWADTPGTFRGVVIHCPEVKPGWMDMKSSNGQVRRGGIRRAEVVSSDGVQTRERQKIPDMSIATEAEVRVTAQQDKDGAWHQSRIE